MIALTKRSTVAQIPLDAAARFSPVDQEREEAVFPVVNQIKQAPSQATRATLLLRIPDALVLAKCIELVEACRETGFSIGVHYLNHRLAALSSTRQSDGSLPERLARPMEIWQRGLIAVAGGMGQ